MGNGFDFILIVTRKYWRVLSREVIWFDLCLEKDHYGYCIASEEGKEWKQELGNVDTNALKCFVLDYKVSHRTRTFSF